MSHEAFSQLPDLRGQVALITGGGRGLGRAFAQALAAAGASVAVTARSVDQVRETAALITAAGGNALALPGDVTDAPSVTLTVDAVVQHFGAVDLLVNNAGVLTPLGPLWEVDPTEWWQTLDINVRGSFLYARAILPMMIARRQGRIINITSPGGWSGLPYASSYCLSKAALSYMVGCLAAETKPYGIAVFSYAPDFVRTAMTEYLVESSDVQRWYGDRFRNRFELGEDTPIERTVGGLLWLASGAGDALSGRNIADWDDLDNILENISEIAGTNRYTLRRIT